MKLAPNKALITKVYFHRHKKFGEIVEDYSAIQEDSSIQEDSVMAPMGSDQDESRRVHVAEFNWKNLVNQLEQRSIKGGSW